MRFRKIQMESAWLDVNHTWSLKWWISKVHSISKDKATVTAGLSNSAGERSLCLPQTLIISQTAFVHRNGVSYWFVEQAASYLEVSLLPTGRKWWVNHAWNLQNGYSVGLEQSPDNEGNCASPSLGETGCCCAIELYAQNQGSRVHQRTPIWWCGLSWVGNKGWCYQMWKCEDFQGSSPPQQQQENGPNMPITNIFIALQMN